MLPPSNETPMLVRIARVLAEPQPAQWPLFLEKARAIMLAMRGPTTTMLEAAHPGLPFFDDLSEDWDRMVVYAASEPAAAERLRA